MTAEAPVICNSLPLHLHHHPSVVYSFHVDWKQPRNQTGLYAPRTT